MTRGTKRRRWTLGRMRRAARHREGRIRPRKPRFVKRDLISQVTNMILGVSLGLGVEALALVRRRLLTDALKR